jgi:hypothetical protein
MSDFGDAIANFMVLLVCAVTFVSLPLWRSEKVQRSKKGKGKGGRRVARKTPKVIVSLLRISGLLSLTTTYVDNLSVVRSTPRSTRDHQGDRHG